MEQQRAELLLQHTQLIKHWEVLYRDKINKLLEEKTQTLIEIQNQFFDKLNEINDISINKAIIKSASRSVSSNSIPSTFPSIPTIPSQTAPNIPSLSCKPNLFDMKIDLNLPILPDLPPVSYILQEALNSINTTAFNTINFNGTNNHNSNSNLNNLLNQNNNNAFNALDLLKSEFDLKSLLSDTTTITTNTSIKQQQDIKPSLSSPQSILPPSIDHKMDIKLNKIQWPCTHCDAAFTESELLIAHLKSHSLGNNTEGHACDECGKLLKSKNNLKRHMRTHTGDKPYACDMCTKAFAQSGTLTVHKRSHTGEKPYKCKECGRAFATFNTLKNHVRIHTGEKPFQCQWCHKKFTQLGSLNTHIRCYCKEKHD